MRSIFHNFLFVLLAFSSGLLSAQDKPGAAAAPNQLRFYIDFAGFRNFQDTSKTYEEIYISFGNYQLSYIKKGARYLAGYHISVTLTDTAGKFVAKKEWDNFHLVDYLKQAENLTSLENAGFLIQPGDYWLDVKLVDLNSGVIGYATFPLQVPHFVADRLQLSEVEFARSISRGDTVNKFIKNNIEVLPNPSRVFGIESPFVYFYAEIYHLTQHAGDSLKKEFSIVDSRGTIVKSHQQIIHPKSGSFIWVGKINMLDAVSGKYVLHLKATDLVTGKVAERQAELWINNPYQTVSVTQYDEQDLKEFRAQIAYLVDKKELDLFDQINLQGKIQYINDFWRSKSPEFRAEHLKRFYSAQQRFGSPNIPGWKSDRGRIFIMYGPPDEIVREPASIDSRAYEIWIYETLQRQGRVQFVFVDYGISGDYQLVHSSLKSGDRFEIYNPNWIDDVKIAR